VADFFVNPDDWHALCSAIDKHGVFPSSELDLIRKDGQQIRAMVSVTLNQGSSPAEDALHFMIKDIEKQRLMREQIAQADKLASIGELSAGIAHEINNPIGIILGYTQLLLRSEDASSERYGDLKTIEKHVRNCKSIVENLLSFARNTPPKKEEVSINGIISDVLHFVQHNLELDDIQIVTHYDETLPNIFLDEPKIKQVLMNLIMNARHAVGKTGTITLSTHFEAHHRHAIVTVKDTGYGVEKKNLPRIFDPFFTTKPTGEGTGLGLSVSYGIIKNHGGDIFVESTPGQGSKFIIDLPATSAPLGG
jgi:signal transduction histidine kinase